MRGSVDFQEPEAEDEGPPEYVVKGFDLLAANNYEESIRYASNLISTYPEDDRIHDTLATAHLTTSQHDQAIEVWTKLEAMFPRDVKVSGRIARTLAEEGNLDQALTRSDFGSYIGFKLASAFTLVPITSIS